MMIVPSPREPSMPRHLALLLLCPLVIGPAACDELLQHLPQGSLHELAPEAEVGALTLRHQPSLEELGAYYCPQVINDPFVRLGCSLAIGPPPPKSQLVFEFGVVLNLHNPNDFPVPALDVLLALTLFDDAQAEALGAICVSLCGTDEPTCDGRPRPGACAPEAGDIRTIDDFIARIPGLIADLASGQAADDLRNSTILAGGDISLDLSFALGIDQALQVFEKTASTYVNNLLEGRNASLVVPVRVDGTVTFRLPALGRLGVDFGPLRTTWQIL